MATHSPKNILITGAAGFIASHVANRLVRNYPEYKIVVLDKLDYCSNLQNLFPSQLSPNFKFVKGDISSANLVHGLLVTESIDTIMHFAAQTHVDNSFANSFEFTKNNVCGTHVLLEVSKVTGQIRRFINVSTDEVYGETEETAVVGCHEASQLLPTNPYSATKAGAEMLVLAYGRSYGVKLARSTILGPGRRGRWRKVIDVAKDICTLFAMDPKTSIKFVENRPHNDQRYFLDNQKLKNLGWSQRTTWQEGLKKTTEWYTSNAGWWGDVSGALLPHPRRLMMAFGGVDKQICSSQYFESGSSQYSQTPKQTQTCLLGTIHKNSKVSSKL
ncbi:hypothetical protein RJ639_042006 [Escallonia herrerae]|uniref:NAD(P)-binding domain-containing protein n=1 Tax=Escallonia herrerae TaxID=1293975 RepID=A0AA89B2H9_9ASTE|nr:hypothetical protein RJ639_042006 [Escallonia herrerae]